MQSINARDFTIGWVCALSSEKAAIKELLDEEYPSPHYDSTDKNDYMFGRIAHHKAVIVTLLFGDQGNTPTAEVIGGMKRTFPSIEHWLMVGIGGGVPLPNDVRLGDIVVSMPRGTHTGVVQYDQGKITPGKFTMTGFCNRPSDILRKAVRDLDVKHFLGESDLSKYISHPKRLKRFARRNTADDILFDAAYKHADEMEQYSCKSCDRRRLVERDDRENPHEVMIHYGTIASGNSLMRDAEIRDKISQALGGVLCFEMEGAGLMKAVEGIVVRGISDYADSHKNKKWQEYAAGIAAAYAKELLAGIPLSRRPEADISFIASAATQIPSNLLKGHSDSDTYLTGSEEDLDSEEDASGEYSYGKTKNRIRCYDCGGRNHYRGDCRPMSDICDHCGERGHWKYGCRASD